MSGLEIAGLVFGGLPLLISAIEHYDDIVQPFQRFKNFVPELELFRIKLLLERATFRNDSRILLESLTDQSTARRALDRSLTTDDSLNQKFADRLGDSLDVWNTAIRVIQDKLGAIQKQSEKFGLILDEPTPMEPAAQIAWRLRVKQKLKFSFSKSSLDSTLTDLRIFTQAFSKLCNQIHTLDQPISRPPYKTVAKPDRRVDDCQKVQTASVQLYDALCNACSTHDEHSAQFLLEPHHIDLDDTGHRRIRFDIAFTRPWNAGEGSLCEPVWLAIESVLGVPIEAATIQTPALRTNIHTPKNFLERVYETTTNHHIKRVKTGKVAFADNAVLQVESLSIASNPVTGLPDFCLRRDFCVCVQRYSQHTLEKLDRCIGYFQASGLCKHIVYFSQSTLSRRANEPISLAEIINSMAQQQRVGSTMPLERVRLAKQLASAVLQFHDTPLLKRSWQSQDVTFFSNSGETALQRQILASPRLNVLVERERQISGPSPEADVSDLLVRNFYLFNLAVVLLEIAYQKPFAKLREETQITNVGEGTLRDFLAAKQLSETVSAKLGSTYGEVVRKCLHCDFNTGAGDLNDSRLQEVVYKEVVIRLEDLEIEMVSRMHGQY